MSTEVKRVQENLEKITAITSSNIGCERFSYSAEDAKAREYIKEKLEKLGVEMQTDDVGNIIATYDPASTGERPFLIGSHIDTVANGGRFDGLLGVLASLEVITTLHQEKITPKHPISLIIFAEEEGSNFQVTMVGSKVFCGQMDWDAFKQLKKKDGTAAEVVLKQAGYNPDEPKLHNQEKINPIGMIEFHIEQGGVLENRSKSIGIVTAIVGMNTFEIILHGQSNHAGTTPMSLRKDPLVVAGSLIAAIQKLPENYGSDLAVATVGRIESEPNFANVISETVKLTVDLRDTERLGIDNMSLALKRLVKKYAQENGVDYEINLLGSSIPVQTSPKIYNIIRKKATELGIDYMMMPSGAVHDCAIVADKSPIAMIFVPSKDGISHSPHEYTADEHIATGVQLFYETVREIVS